MSKALGKKGDNMEEVPTYKYDQLKAAPELSELSAFNLILSGKQASSLQKAEKRIQNYQMLEALNHNRLQTIFAAISVFAGELIELLLNPNLCEVRGLMLSGRITTTKYVFLKNGTVHVTISLM